MLSVQGTGTDAAAGAGGSGAGAGGGPGSGGQGAGLVVDDGWWDPAFSRRVRIIFNNDGGESLSGFPVMIRLNANRIDYAEVNDDASDLRFVDTDNATVLPHEVELWNEGGTSTVWVRVPRIDASNVDHIWMYFGNAGATAAEKPAQVWEDFVGVYHFLKGSRGRDSSPASHNASQVSSSGEVLAELGQALQLDGNGHLRVGGVSSDFSVPENGTRTVELWFKTTEQGVQSAIYQEAFCRGWGVDLGVQDILLRGHLSIDSDGCPGDYQSASSGQPSSADGQWHHVALVINRGAGLMSLYLDGAFKDSTPISPLGPADSDVATIGAGFNDMNRFRGQLDEVRVSTAARGDAWILAQHRSMTDALISAFNVPESAP